jgi:outer membrane protein OmpA-like peptidoglycan-associated protein
MQTQIDPAGLKLHRQQMLTLTPVLRSTDRTQSRTFDPVVILGKTRYRTLRRAERLSGFTLSPEPQVLAIYHKKTGIAPIPLRLETAYEPWMQSSELVMMENVTGCRDKVLAQNEYRTIENFLAPPAYTVAYATPPVETVKNRNEIHTARINFEVNRYDIRRDDQNNAAVLDDVDRVIREVKSDPNLTIGQFRVTGYASPEGSAASNLRLSEYRAKALVDYLRATHGIPAGDIQADWKGDDWDGLRTEMERSNFAGKNRVLDILNGTTDPALRKSRLRELGADYQTLLRDYYPLLRRNEYMITYVARAFSVEEARERIRTRPSDLSLDEMFRLANSYPKNSEEFKNVFDIASRIYPQNEYAQLNSAALEIERGAWDTALAHLQGIEMPEAWNNIGLICIHQRDYAKAAEYLTRAADAGNRVALENLNLLNQWRQTQK